MTRVTQKRDSLLLFEVACWFIGHTLLYDAQDDKVGMYNKHKGKNIMQNAIYT